MADLQTSTPHPSMSSASASTAIYYDVFINHRGPDVKNTFASHLYHRLISHGLQPFLDREELQAGDYLAPQIEGAIKTASVHVTIFSPTYAESKWCLDELVLILKSGVSVIPVFHNVKPSELRWTGRYAQALNNHEQKRRYDPQTLESWRKALFDVSSLIGFELEAYNGDEGKLLENVVRCVLKKCSKTLLHVAIYPTGLKEKVAEFEKIVSLQQRSWKAQVLGIVGSGGVGKTTLAKEFFNRKSSEFNKSCFLFDVREIAGRNSINFLQRKLLKGLTHKDLQIDSVSEGIEVLRMNISFSSTLIILDDVDDVAQLEAFLPLKDVLHPDSLILITSRNRDVLTSSGIAELSIYKLTCLDLQHSQQLFCSHAFCQPYPPPGFHSLVDEFSRACNGLPLSLKVFGALLCGNNNKSYWGDQLGKLREIILPKEILKCLEISYDALSGEERQIFLDVACYFIGEDSDMAIRIWDASGWKGSVGLLNLQNKSLVDVDRDNKIEMHDHLRDLGRAIADREMPIRLWRRPNNIQVPWQQLYNGQGITRVRGIRADDDVIFYGSTSPGITNRFKSWSFDQFRKLRIVETVYKFLPSLLSAAMSQNLIWLRLNNCPYSYLPSWIPMKNLRVLDVKGNKFLWRRKSQAPLELRELNISSSLLKFPKSIGQLKHLEKIVVDFRGIGHLKALPEEFCDLRSLKYLHLSHQHSMERLPASFGHLTNLQHLDLSDCMTLRMLPNTFGNLNRLKYLNLRNCFNLTMSDETFDYISTLEYLELSKCHSIKVLPLQVAYQPSMEEIHLLSMFHLKELPEDIERLCNLEVLSIGSPLLERLPRSLGLLTSLKQLRLEGCDKLECLPNSLGMLTQLSTLRIRGCGILYLPQEAVRMNNLVKLSLLWCPLRELPWQELVEGQRETLADPTGRGKMIEMDLSIYNAQHQQCMHRLEYLELLQTEISEIFFSQGVCPNLKHLDIQHCYNLVKVGGLPHTLITVKLLGCEKLREVGGLCNLTELQELNIGGCKVEELPGLERLISLKKLEVSRCQKLRRIWGLWRLNKLRVLDVNHCHALEELPGVENMRSLERLSAINCYRLRWWGEAEEKLKSRLQGAFTSGFQHILE